VSESSAVNGGSLAIDVDDRIDVIIDLTDPATTDSVPLVVHGVPGSLRAWATSTKAGSSSTAKGIEAVGSTVVAWALAIVLGTALPSPVGLVVGWTILLFVLFRMQNLLHEAAHRGVFASTRANDVVNAVVGAVLFAPGAAYRAYHFTHHGYTRVDGKDPEAFYESVKSRPMYLVTMLGGGPLFALGMIAGTLQCAVGARPAWVTSDRAARNVRNQGLASLAISVLAVVGLIQLGLSGPMLRWWLIPVAAFLCGPFTWATFFEHSGAQRNAPILTSSGTVRSNRFFAWVMLNGNFHLAHHLLPTTAWWKLPALDAEIQALPGGDTTAPIRHSGFFAFHRQLWRSLGTR
jgi:fatty acid desaturase